MEKHSSDKRDPSEIGFPAPPFFFCSLDNMAMPLLMLSQQQLHVIIIFDWQNDANLTAFIIYDELFAYRRVQIASHWFNLTTIEVL